MKEFKVLQYQLYLRSLEEVKHKVEDLEQGGNEAEKPDESESVSADRGRWDNVVEYHFSKIEQGYYDHETRTS